MRPIECPLVIKLNFHHHRLSGFRDVMCGLCPLPLLRPLAYTAACTTVQLGTSGDMQDIV